MEFTLNIVYGGELNASKALSPFVRNMRKIIKDTFTSFENEAVTMFKVTLFFDGDISSYYNGTGIYQPRYYNVKKEYVVSFCIDRTQWTGNKEKDLNYFIFTITSLMIKNGDLILNKLAKYSPRNIGSYIIFRDSLFNNNYYCTDEFVDFVKQYSITGLKFTCAGIAK